MLEVGQATGVVWTPGGSSLIQIKAKVRKGRGKVTINGEVGEEFISSFSNVLHLLQFSNEFDLLAYNVTVNVAGPLEGPSAALACFVALYSALTKNPVNQNVAFTGALSRYGVVEPVDEVISKLTAIKRGNLAIAVFPMDNLWDLSQTNIQPFSNLVLHPVLRLPEVMAVIQSESKLKVRN